MEPTVEARCPEDRRYPLFCWLCVTQDVLAKKSQGDDTVLIKRAGVLKGAPLSVTRETTLSVSEGGKAAGMRERGVIKPHQPRRRGPSHNRKLVVKSFFSSPGLAPVTPVAEWKWQAT